MWTAVRPTSLATSLKVGMGAKPLRSFLAGVGSLGRGTRTLPGCWLGACGREGAAKARIRMRAVRMKRPAKPSSGLAGRGGSRLCQYNQKVNRIEYWNCRLRSDIELTVPTWAFGVVFWTETAFARGVGVGGRTPVMGSGGPGGPQRPHPFLSRNSGLAAVFTALKPTLAKPWLLPRLPYCGWLKRLKAS